MFIFILIAAFFILIANVRFRLIPFTVIGTISILLLLYFFGVLGNIRESAEAKSDYDPDIFTELAHPTERLKNSIVPKEFFWSYIYITSPLANLQTNINTPRTDSLHGFWEHANNEMMFDFLSKRINRMMGWERISEFTIPGPFNVSTIYSRSFSYQGWLGLILMAVFVFVYPWMYHWLLPQNPYTLTGLAILATMYLFLVYDNTIRFTGLGFQLVYPFIFPLFIKIQSWVRQRMRK